MDYKIIISIISVILVFVGYIPATEIHVTYYKDGEPVSGSSAARYISGEWKIL